MPDGPRFAIYWAPPQYHPLWTAGAEWLGRDPAGGVPVQPSPVADLPDVTAEAARYGFHATLKPPMRLRDEFSRADLIAAAGNVAATQRAFAMPAMAVADLDGFLCLRETRECTELQTLCDALVAGVEVLRRPLSDAELQRRRAATLAPAEAANLARWGYPHVFDTWYFHMTLSRRLSAAEHAMIRPLAEHWFEPALVEPVMAEDVCIFEQPHPGAAFGLAARVPLGE